MGVMGRGLGENRERFFYLLIQSFFIDNRPTERGANLGHPSQFLCIIDKKIIPFFFFAKGSVRTNSDVFLLSFDNTAYFRAPTAMEVSWSLNHRVTRWASERTAG